MVGTEKPKKQQLNFIFFTNSQNSIFLSFTYIYQGESSDQAMLSENANHDSNPQIHCATTLDKKKAKLMIDFNEIKTSRSSKKNIFPSIFDSLKHMVKDQKYLQNSKSIQGNSVNNVSGSKPGKVIKESLKGYRKRKSQRIHTMQIQENQQIQPSLQYRKDIAQKVFKITQQLGMAEAADYRNYMKTERSQQSRFFSSQKPQKTKATPFIQQRRTENQIHYHGESPERKESRKKVEKVDPTIMYVLKCNLKKKPAIRELSKVHQGNKKNQRMSMQGKDLYGMNKSIRGWTKYGKMQEEIQS